MHTVDVRARPNGNNQSSRVHHAFAHGDVHFISRVFGALFNGNRLPFERSRRRFNEIVGPKDPPGGDYASLYSARVLTSSDNRRRPNDDTDDFVRINFIVIHTCALCTVCVCVLACLQKDASA